MGLFCCFEVKYSSHENRVTSDELIFIYRLKDVVLRVAKIDVLGNSQ